MKFVKFLFSPLFMGILFVVFALSMAVATFVENDLGTAAAYNLVYNAKWFELILLLLAVNLVGQVFQPKTTQKRKASGCPVPSLFYSDAYWRRNNQIFWLGRDNSHPQWPGPESMFFK